MDRSNERTETDERVAENATPAPRTSAVAGRSGAPLDEATGLPKGMHDDDRSPIDRAADLAPSVMKTQPHEPSQAERQILESEPATESNAHPR